MLLVVLTGCTAGAVVETDSTGVSASSSTTSSTSTTSTTMPEEPIPMTALRLIDPATLEPITPSLDIPGWPWGEAGLLPDGRLLFFSGMNPEPDQQWLSTVDFRKGVAQFTEIPFSPAEILGYSHATKRVVLMLTSDEGTRLVLVDPIDLSFVEQPTFQEEGHEWWPFRTVLFDSGRKIAFYSALGQAVEHLDEPPQVTVLDLETNLLGDPVSIEGVVHGLVELSEEFIRYPDFPYGEVEPGIVFDTVDGRLYAAHADGKGLTVVNLLTNDVDVVSLEPQPSFWGRALSWLIPPAEAKGSEPSATISAWLSPDRRFLYVTGEADDAWRDSDKRLHTMTEPLGLMVVDTQTLELVRSLELPVSRGLSTDSGVALTGTTSKRIWCDEECNPDNNEPEVEGGGEATGLYILDPDTLDIREQLHPGVFFYYMDSFEDWVISEDDIPQPWGYQSIDTRTGEMSPVRPTTGTSSLIVTEAGIIEIQVPDFDS
jgi:hypothetical protein